MTDTVKASISYDEDLEEVIQNQIDAGIAGSRSEWFQEAAYQRLALQDLAAEAQGARIRHNTDGEGDE